MWSRANRWCPKKVINHDDVKSAGRQRRLGPPNGLSGILFIPLQISFPGQHGQGLHHLKLMNQWQANPVRIALILFLAYFLQNHLDLCQSAQVTGLINSAQQ